MLINLTEDEKTIMCSALVMMQAKLSRSLGVGLLKAEDHDEKVKDILTISSLIARTMEEGETP